MNYFSGFVRIKYYVIFMVVLFAGYVWASINGTRIMGDDNDSRAVEQVGKRAHGNSFYHK